MVKVKGQFYHDIALFLKGTKDTRVAKNQLIIEFILSDRIIYHIVLSFVRPTSI